MTDANLLSLQTDRSHQITDPFNNIAKKIRSLKTPISKLDLSVTNATRIVRKIDELFTAINDICQAITATHRTCLVLTPIPLVGEIAKGLANILDRVANFAQNIRSKLKLLKQDVVDDAGSRLDRVKIGLNKFQEVTKQINRDLPQLTEIVTAVDSAFHNSQPLGAILTAENADDRLERFVQDYQSIELAILDIETAIDRELIPNIADFSKLLKYDLTSLESAIDGAIDKIKIIESLLAPIKNAIQEIEKVIAPVKWVFDAVEYIFNEIFKPIIAKILEITGLQHLIDNLEQKLEEVLGIFDIFKQIKKVFNLQKITDCSTFLDVSSNSNAVSVLIDRWNFLARTLAGYSQYYQHYQQEQALRSSQG